MQMEQTASTNKNPSLFLFLAVDVALIMAGVALFFANGMDTDRFFVVVDRVICALPLALSWFVYIGLEFASLIGRNETFFVYQEKGHEKTVKISFAITLICAFIGTIIVLAMNNNGQNVVALNLELLAFGPGMLYYLGRGLVGALNREEEGPSILIHIAHILFTFALMVAVICFNAFISTGWSIILVGIPLQCLVLAFAGRKDDLGEAGE